MATTNQKIVAEALRLARDNGFSVGLTFLSNLKKIPGNGESSLSWFANKCLEHKIPSPLFPQQGETT